MPATATPPKDPVTGKFLPKTEPQTSADVPPVDKQPEEPKAVPQAVEDFFEQGIGIRVKKKDQAPPPEEKEKEDAPPAPPAKPKAAKPRPARQEPAMTAQDIATATAEAVARVMKPAAPATEKEEEFKLPAEVHETVAVLEQMEKLYGDRYKGLSKKYTDSLAKLDKYAKEWETANPGQEFDENAPEHAAFFEANDVTWEDKDEVQARVKLEVERELAPERERRAQEARVQAAQPKLAELTTEAGNLFWSLHDVKDPSKFDDPVAAPHLQRQANILNFETSVLFKVMNGLEKWMEQEPPVGRTQEERMRHDVWLAQQEMSRFAAAEEAKFAAKPEVETVDAEGRRFLPAEQYYKTPKAQRADYWTFSVNDVAALRAKHLAQEAKKTITAEEERLSRIAKARGWDKGTAQVKNGKPAVEEEEETTVIDDGKPTSPESAPESKVAATRRGAKPNNEDFASSFISAGIGGR
jgi:hypothetical protein